METKKVLGIIFSVLFIGAFAFVLSWGIINFNKVKDGMSGIGVYTQEDINNAYEDGYNTALEDKDEYDELIDSYRDTITSQTDQISQLNSQITILNNNNKDYKNQVSNLESQKTSLQEQVVNLTTIKSNNETTISQLNTQITQLQKEVADLENSGEYKDETIAQKNIQITNLQSTVLQLQKTNELNVETITNLNNQIASLNTQITDMTLQIQNNSTNVTALNNKIAELEKSVSYYEQYIANLESGEQVVATFEFNGSVYNIQIVNKNDTVSVINPTSTDYVIFNYWTVNDEQIDLSTYPITTNTKIVANVTYKYDVKFMVDNETYNSQIVVKNGYATVPTNPTKDGYEFDGWTINGVDIVNPNSTEISQNTTYTAKFTKLHTVTFMYEDSTYSIQTVRNNEVCSNVSVDNTDYKVFNGWKLNGAIVDIANQKIVADTTFVADITYKYDVKFMVDDSVYNSQIVTQNSYATIPEIPAKSEHEFLGWSLDGSNIVNVSTYSIVGDKNFFAVFKKLSCIYEIQITGLEEYLDDNITKYMWTDGKDVYYSELSDGYIFDKETKSWSEIYFAGLPSIFSGCSFSGSYVWNDGANTYFSFGKHHYAFDSETKTWNAITWYGDITQFYGMYVWSDNENIYYSRDSKHYMLDRETKTWTEITFAGSLNLYSYSDDIWSDGTNVYYSNSTQEYILNKETRTWEIMTWNNEDISFLYGQNVYNIGEDIYYSCGSKQYKLDKETKTWNAITWSGDIDQFSGEYVWSDGENYYVQSGEKLYIIYI